MQRVRAREESAPAGCRPDQRGPTHVARLEFPRETGLILRCAGIPDSSDGKESACNAGNLGLIPGLGKSPGEGKGSPLQDSGLENSMDCSLSSSSLHGDSPGRNTAVGCHALPQEIFPVAALATAWIVPRPRPELPRFNSWVGNIHWRMDKLPTPVFLGFHGGSAG